MTRNAITNTEIAHAIEMRMKGLAPAEIAKALGTGRTAAAIDTMLSQEKKWKGLKYPPLKRLRHKTFKNPHYEDAL